MESKDAAAAEEDKDKDGLWSDTASLLPPLPLLPLLLLLLWPESEEAWNEETEDEEDGSEESTPPFVSIRAEDFPSFA